MNKKLFAFSFLFLFFAGSFSAGAQGDKSKRPSPPATTTGKIGDATVTISYSSPAVKARKVWGETGAL